MSPPMAPTKVQEAYGNDKYLSHSCASQLGSQHDRQLMPVQPVLVHIGVVRDHRVRSLDIGVVVQPVEVFISSAYHHDSLRTKEEWG